MNKTIQAIINLLHTQVFEWSITADKYAELGKLLNDPERYAQTTVTYRTCCADLTDLAKQIEKITIGSQKEHTDEG